MGLKLEEFLMFSPRERYIPMFKTMCVNSILMKVSTSKGAYTKNQPIMSIGQPLVSSSKTDSPSHGKKFAHNQQLLSLT